ncbi:hypothetical protein BB560_001659 [Smittium megazygosporum]|uniref:mitogen-activated protein kinase kinase kinase n=1 Tax=Smittium megazygosporum TaxID=133381 RepID=A0A2T9ZGY7_9FUNG|nr:hypothetical protein BB560_001659 [Smittium megazygosporum]
MSQNLDKSLAPDSAFSYKIREILDWDINQVDSWLQKIGFVKYSQLFEDNKINGEALLELNYSYLKDLGISSVGDRVKLGAAITRLRESSLKIEKEILTGTTFIESLTEKLDGLNLLDFSLDSISPKHKETDFNKTPPQNQNTISASSSIQQSASAKSSFNLKRVYKYDAPTRTTSKFHNLLKKHSESSIKSHIKNWLSSPELTPSIPNSPLPLPTDSAKNYGFGTQNDSQSIELHTESLFLDSHHPRLLTQKARAGDLFRSSSPKSPANRQKGIVIKGPNNESKDIPFQSSLLGKEILELAISAFGLANSLDKDKYSIFIMSSEGDGARIVEGSEVFSPYSENGNTENIKLFLKKRHDLGVASSLERDAELQRTIQKLGNFVYANSVSKVNANSPIHSTPFHYSKPKSSFSNSSTKEKESPTFAQTIFDGPSSNNVVYPRYHVQISQDPGQNLEKLHSFFGQRPPSDQVHKNLDIFFPGNEENARNSIMRGHMKKTLYIATDPKNKKSQDQENYLSSSSHGDSSITSAINGKPLNETYYAIHTEILNSNSSNKSFTKGPYSSNQYSIKNKTRVARSNTNRIPKNYKSFKEKTETANKADPSKSEPYNTGPSSIEPNLHKPSDSSSNNGVSSSLETSSMLHHDQNDSTSYNKFKQSLVNNRNSLLSELKKEFMESSASSWIKGAHISSGSFGNVFYGIHTRTGVIMAVKQVDIPTDDLEIQSRRHKMFNALKGEIELLKTLDHKNIVRYLGYESDPKSLYIFLEYVPGGSVKSALSSFGAFPESLVEYYISQILEGLAYLHNQNIIHCDIKGGNILIDHNGRVKISDFGISKKVDETVFAAKNRLSLQGSVYWMAPEVVKDANYTVKCDIWSLGCLVIEMLTGSHPFPDNDQFQALLKIGNKVKPHIPSGLSPEASDFIEKTLAIDLEQRPTALELLSHPFVNRRSRH